MFLVSQAALHAYHSALVRRNESGEFEFMLMKHPELCSSAHWENILKSAERPETAREVIDLMNRICDTDAIEVGKIARYVQMTIGTARKTLFDESIKIAKQSRRANSAK